MLVPVLLQVYLDRSLNKQYVEGEERGLKASDMKLKKVLTH